jgi:tetratricopeptide (TPR) repeat protein
MGYCGDALRVDFMGKLSLRHFSGRRLSLVLLLSLLTAGLALWGGRAWWIDHHLKEAQKALTRQRFSEARFHLDRVLWLRPSDADVHLLAGRAARRAGDAEAARKHYQQCQKFQSSPSEELSLERAMLKAQSEDVDAFFPMLWPYVERGHPDSALILEALCVGCLGTSRYGLAKKCLERWLPLEPENVQAHFFNGQFLNEASLMQEAITSFRRALELDPTRVDIRCSLADTLLAIKEHSQAIEQYEEVLRQDPRSAQARLGLARASIDLGQIDRAVPMLEALVQEEPGNADALCERGRAALQSGANEEAERWLRAALKVDPGHYKANFTLVSCLHGLGKEKEASQQKETYQRLDYNTRRIDQILRIELPKAPRNPNLYYELGRLWFENERKKEAVRWLYEALKLDPNHRPSHELLVRYYQEIGDPKGVELHQRMATRAAAEFPATSPPNVLPQKP